MSNRIGTSGWRAATADEFTFAGVRGGVARSAATSYLVDRVAKKPGLSVFETSVGSKYIGELINEDKIILGGEESAGVSIKGHYPEKDGVLACLLAAEAVAARNASLTEHLNLIRGRFMVTDVPFGHRTTRPHLRGIRISKGLGGAS